MVASEQTGWHPDEYVSDETLEERTEVSRRQWQRWRAQGSGPPHVALGPRLIRYRWGDVLKWLAQPGHGGGER